MNTIKDMPFFVSWSEGKNISLALNRALREGGKMMSLPVILLDLNQECVFSTHGMPWDGILK